VEIAAIKPGRLTLNPWNIPVKSWRFPINPWRLIIKPWRAPNKSLESDKLVKYHQCSVYRSPSNRIILGSWIRIRILVKIQIQIRTKERSRIRIRVKLKGWELWRLTSTVKTHGKAVEAHNGAVKALLASIEDSHQLMKIWIRIKKKTDPDPNQKRKVEGGSASKENKSQIRIEVIRFCSTLVISP
jgi:hypothetical protein